MHTETRGQPFAWEKLLRVHPSLNSHFLFYSNGLPNLAQYAMYIRDIEVNDDHKSAIFF